MTLAALPTPAGYTKHGAIFVPDAVLCLPPIGCGGAATRRAQSSAAVAAPTVSGITPDTGRSNGGQSITITGSGFTGATGATIGGAAITSFLVVNDTTITGISPSGTAGTSGNVAVTGPGGTGSLAAAFYFLEATNLELWFRGDLGVTASGGLVGTWANQSGSADANRNLTQATGANKPRLAVTSTTFNNKPTVGTLSGTDEDLYMDSGTFAASVASPQTVYDVIRLPAGFAANVALRWNASGYANAPSFVIDTTPVFYASTDGVNLLSGAISAGTTYVSCTIYNGASSAVYLSSYNTATASGNAGASAISALHVGTIPGFASRWERGELIAYADAHGSAKRQEIMSYLGTRYGVSITA